MGSLTQVLAPFYDRGMGDIADALAHVIYGLQNSQGTIVSSLGGVASQTYVTAQISGTTLGDLSGVLLGTPTTGQNLTFSGTRWINKTPTSSTATGTNPGLADVRVSLSSSQPVTTANVSSGKVYCHAFHGNRVALRVSSAWEENSLTSVLSVSVPATANKMFDLTLHKSGSALKFTTTLWTNDTTRATPIKMQDGVPILSGTTKRLIASGRTSASGKCYLTETHGYLANVQNRRPIKLKKTDTTNSWNSTNTSLHPWHSGTTNRIHYIVPLDREYMLDAEFVASCGGDNTGNPQIGIGVDSTSADSSDVRHNGKAGSTERVTMVARYTAFQSAGKHYLQPLEAGIGAGTTFYGDDGGTMQAGVIAKTDG